MNVIVDEYGYKMEVEKYTMPVPIIENAMTIDGKKFAIETVEAKQYDDKVKLEFGNKTNRIYCMLDFDGQTEDRHLSVDSYSAKIRLLVSIYTTTPCKVVPMQTMCQGLSQKEQYRGINKVHKASQKYLNRCCASILFRQGRISVSER